LSPPATTIITNISIAPGRAPNGIAMAPDGKSVYVTTWSDFIYPPGDVYVIDTASNTVTAVIPVELSPEGIAVTPDGGKLYVANAFSDAVSVIDTATNAVTAPPWQWGTCQLVIHRGPALSPRPASV
jgi:YVTN family beta-propeller protein